MAETDGAGFFTPDGDALIPAPHAGSPWAEDMLHGRLLGGLLAHALERDHAEPGLRFSRLTVDLFRNTRMVPVQVVTERIRDGRRIRVADAAVLAGGTTVARASGVLLRSSEQPAGEVPATRPWDAPTPDELGPPPVGSGWQPPFGTWLLDDEGRLSGDWTATRRRAWIREYHALIDGEPLSPFVRAAIAADFASPLAHFGSRALEFINADYTLTLARSPLGADIGVEATGHISDDGVAVGDCTLHDTAGPLGFCTTTAVANPPFRTS
ncbi:thioesterase family protein [Saccharopolyspora rosea]|uniref:Thioesterase family protein n=1 Tax=Saccharopolyspora rosea TaxID=524884 RepID=A0ABW3G1H8_9PSEU|nr:thioesterase family protein [Saccharopolyspora rosea]